MDVNGTFSLERQDQTFHDGLSRRGFLRGMMIGGIGAATLGASPSAMARALLSGKTAADIQGAGVAKGIVRLNQNENPLGPSPKAVEAITKHLHELNRYVDDFSVIMNLYMRLNMMNGVRFDDLNLQNPAREDMQKAQERNRVFLSDGSANILRAVTLTYLQDGGEVIEAEGGYGDVSEFAMILKQRGRDVTVTRVPLTAEKRHDLEAMRKAITPQTKLVVITNPNNPTGTIVSHDELERFVNSVPETVKILVDEAYIHFVKDPAYKNAADLALSRPNVLVSRTFSKVYGLPGLRVGYALGMPKDFQLFWVFTGSVTQNLLCLHGALAALDDVEHVRRSQQTIWDAREYLSKELKAMNLSYTPTESNFMVIEVKNPQAVVEQLAKQKVLIRDAERRWGVKGHIRVSVGTMEENEVFINALRQALAQVGA
ncbi:MAG: aminotransferase class I/II-fold pyridoxal phosphate-dependent enzyme [Candidatus Latescibacteria bacterium]|nr:aminotransferase class I/II-fold pyridoxal phosphate-dependent enzyme [Candidatus Latescibacterota bacterium]